MKYYKDGKEVKRANTVKQRLSLLKKYTNNTYKIVEHPYYGYAIFENEIKIFDSPDKYNFLSMLGRLCYDYKITDIYGNILIFK